MEEINWRRIKVAQDLVILELRPIQEAEME